MAKRIDLQFVKTYASVENAEKAIAKVLGNDHGADFDSLLTYSVIPTFVDGRIRYGIVFYGERAVQAGLHFHFNVVN